MPWSPAVGVGGWVLSLLAIAIVAPLVVGIMMLAGFELDDLTVLLIPLSPVVTGLVALGVAMAVSGGSVRTLFGAGRFGLRPLFLGIAIGVGAFVLFNMLFGALLVYVLELLGAAPPEVQQTLRDAAERPEALPILVVSTTIAAPLGEELLYRGLLFQSLLRRFSPASAMVLSALAFSVGHVTVGAPWLSNLVVAVLILPLGVVLAWAFHRWQTLWVPIAIHCAFNAVTVVLMAAGTI